MKSIKELSLSLKQLSKAELVVGWVDNSLYDDGASVAKIAIIQEYGSPNKNIPPRPFMRPAIAENQSKWVETITKAVVEKGMNTKQALNVLGLQIQGDLQQAIENVVSPSLAPSTMKARIAKGNTNAKPLIDTSKMIKSVTYYVK